MAINKQGTFKLSADIMEYIEERRERALEDPEFAQQILDERELVDAEARAHIEMLQGRRREERELAKLNQQDDDDDYDVEVVYTNE